MPHVAWPGAQPLGQSISLKFSLETWLKSKSFEPLINILAFLVQKLWSKITKLFNYLISWLIKHFYYFRSWDQNDVFNFEPNVFNLKKRKIFLWLGVRIFCDWWQKWSSCWVILAHVTWPREQPLGQRVSLKFSLETRLKFESFKALIDFLVFLVQKLW